MATRDLSPTASPADRAWLSLLGRLNHQSVTRDFDAYADIDWDGPELALDPEDPRWELPADDPLGGTAWYRARPAATRARLGCELVASKMKIGLVFESVLKPPGRHHRLAGQGQEAVRRARPDPGSLPGAVAAAGARRRG